MSGEQVVIRPQQAGNETRRADAAERARAGAELRVAGFTWEQIADRLGYAHTQGAHRAVTEHFDSLPLPDVAELRRELLERTSWLWQEAAVDVADRKPGAVTAAVKVLDRLARLVGADAPARAEIEHHSTRTVWQVVYPVAEVPAVGALIELEANT